MLRSRRFCEVRDATKSGFARPVLLRTERSRILTEVFRIVQ
jgi:hypothetical protein